MHKLKTVINVEKIITFHYFELPENFDYPAEKHDFWEFHYVDKDHIESGCDGKPYNLKRGEIIFHKPMSEHYIKAEKNTSPNVCVVSFFCSSNDMYYLADKVFSLDDEQNVIMQKLVEEAGSVFDINSNNPEIKCMEMSESRNFGSEQLIKIRLEELFISLIRSLYTSKNSSVVPLVDKYDSPLINEVVLYLQSHVTENVSIEDLCAKFCFSKTHLCSLFYSVTKKTIHKYFSELKIKTAKQLIRQKKQTRSLMKEISDYLNYTSPVYFYYAFKKSTGMTPSEYSKSVNKYKK